MLATQDKEQYKKYLKQKEFRDNLATDIRNLCRKKVFLPDALSPFPFLKITLQEVQSKFSQLVQTEFKLVEPQSTTEYFVHRSTFQPQFTKLFLLPMNRYVQYGQIADASFECVRMQSRRKDMRLNPLEMWAHPDIRKKLQQVSQDLKVPLRTICFKYMKQCDVFEVTTVKALLSHYQSKKVLDPCAGWGDRLVGALSTPGIQLYYGVDRNVDLRPAYQHLIKNLTFTGKLSGEVQLYFEDFLTHRLPKDIQFDTVFTCPPYYNLEIYSGQEETRSLSRWIKEFLAPLIQKCMRALKKGGIFILAMNDCASVLDKGGYTEMAIETIRQNQGILMDVIGQVAECWIPKFSNRIAVVPVWVFKKMT